MRRVGRSWGWVLAVIVSTGFGASALELRIVDVTAERPLPGVQVEWGLDGGTNRSAVSGPEGRVSIPVDSGSAAGLRLGASKPGHVSMIMTWPAGRVPGRFDWRLPESKRVGGTVVDGEDRPIAGARVSLRIPRRLAGPHVIPEGLVVTTGADGKWVCSQVPANAAYVKVEVSHPDFLSPDADEPAESALRAMAARHRLKPVFSLNGRVIDASGRGVSGAEVILGSEAGLWPDGNLPIERTDASGRFTLRRILAGPRVLGVTAEGAAPELVPVTVSAQVRTVDVRLGAGSPMALRVVDPAGRGVEGVKVTVDEWPVPSSVDGTEVRARWSYPGWEWTTDANGRVVWSNAPPGAMAVTLRKGGYMTRGRQEIRSAGEEGVFTMSPAFRLGGRVTDAGTGRPVPAFVVSTRFIREVGQAKPMMGRWSEYERRAFGATEGEYQVEFENPLLWGTPEMHDWQFRIDADGYRSVTSRVVRDSERGGRLDFALEPMPAPIIPVPEPTAENRLAIGARWEPERLGPGERATLFVRIRLAPGFHVYALEDSGGSNLPTALDAEWPRLKTEGPWHGPPPRVDEAGARIHDGEVWFRRDFVVADGTNPGPMKVPLSVRYQVCNEAFCWPPSKVDLEAVLEVVASNR